MEAIEIIIYVVLGVFVYQLILFIIGFMVPLKLSIYLLLIRELKKGFLPDEIINANKPALKKLAESIVEETLVKLRLGIYDRGKHQLAVEQALLGPRPYTIILCTTINCIFFNWRRDKRTKRIY